MHLRYRPGLKSVLGIWFLIAALAPAVCFDGGIVQTLAGTIGPGPTPPGNPSSPSGPVTQASPMAPNEGLVTGEIVSLEAVQSSTLRIMPPQILTLIRLRVLSIQGRGTINPLRGWEGSIIEVYSKAPLGSGLVGKKVKGVVTYRGDERGGLYWIYDLQEMPSG